MARGGLRRGSSLGKYRLERRLGQGSFAEVWRARDTVLHRAVALKVAHTEVVEEWGRDAIEHEARLAARLDHPNIVRVRDADWVGGRFVMATDLAERSLEDFSGARRSGRLALRLVREIASALAYAHKHRVLHRDVKPDNILIFRDGHAGLTDFGVARFARSATRTYTKVGTLGYIAPEQAYGRPRFASDVFSLGLVAYELLTGVLATWPFDWPPPGHDRFAKKVPAQVQPVLRKAMALDPRRRFADGVALVEALESGFRRSEKAAEAPRRPRKRNAKTPASPLSVQAELFRKRHGRALGMHYTCYRCDGPIAEPMKVCPWCGTGDHSFLDVTSAPLACPECERGVRPEWTSCPWCYAGRLAGNGRPPRSDPKAERRCSRKGCSGELRPFMRYCPVCKQKPRRLWSHPELPDRCSGCRWPTSASFWRFCPWCGRREPRAGSFVRNGR